MNKPQRNWVPWEKHLAWDMKHAGKSIHEIAEALQRSYSSVDGQLRQDKTNEARRRRNRPMVRPFFPVIKVAVPPKLLDERDYRANEPRTISQTLMGDPPFSQSALARAVGKDGGARVSECATVGFGQSADDGP